MSLNDQIVVQNVDPVQAASGDMTLAQIDDIERRACATATVLQAETSQQGDAANEAKVASEIGMEVAGGGMLKLASAVCEIMGDRLDAGSTHLSQSIEGRTDGIVTGNATTMDQMIRNSFRGEQLVMGANIAESSLRGQGNSVATWDVPSAKVAGGGGVELARRLTFEKVNANQHAWDSVPAARANYAANMHRTMQIAPGMGMSPNLRPSEMRAMADDRLEDVNNLRFRQEGEAWSEA